MTQSSRNMNINLRASRLMKSPLFALVLSAFSIGVFAQEVPAEPEYVNQYFVLRNGKLDRLEHDALTMQSKMRNHIIAIKTTVSQSVSGTQSSIRVRPDAHFVVRMDTGDTDPATMVILQEFKIGKGDREILRGSAGAHVFGGGHSNTPDATTLPITVKKYGAKSFEVIPSQPLAPGEYFFTVSGSQADCFGVDAK